MHVRLFLSGMEPGVEEMGTGPRLGWEWEVGACVSLGPGPTDTRARPIVRMILQVFR